MTATADVGPRALAEQIGATGAVAVAMAAVPRGQFVPAQVWVEEADRGYVPVDRDAEPERWTQNVYSNRVVVTQFDDGRTAWPNVGARPSCSSSMPSAVAEMLAALHVAEGHRVLDVGTGTGWTAALLAELVGSTGTVTTVDVDPALAADAERRLTAAGCRGVRVLCGDGTAVFGADKTRDQAPFDRVHVTAGVQLGRLPWAWVEAVRPGGIILAPMRTEITSGPLVAFHVDEDGSATGRALDTRVGFMELREQRTPVAQFTACWDDPGADVTTTDVEPWVPLLAEAPRWAIAVAVPSCRVDVWKKTAERAHGVAWLVDPVSGSWASVVPADHDGLSVVRQSGPRRLWDAAEAAYRWWLAHGEPELEAWLWRLERDAQSVTLNN